jgi:hypothetical protein
MNYLKSIEPEHLLPIVIAPKFYVLRWRRLDKRISEEKVSAFRQAA